MPRSTPDTLGPSRRLGRFELLEERLPLDASLLLDINTVPVAAGSYPHLFTGVSDEVFFVASDINGDEVWKTDGQHTELVADFDPNFRVTPSDTFSGLVRTVENLFPWDAGTGIETAVGSFYYDGSETLQFAGEILGDAGGWMYDIRRVTPLEPARLIRVDPQEQTSLLFATSSVISAPTTADHAVLDGNVLVSAGDRLWITNGTLAGTRQIGDALRPHSFQTVGDQVYFFAQQTNAYELWVTDRTNAGTHRVKTFVESSLDESGRSLVLQTLATDQHLYAVVSTAVHEGVLELWRSDGTEAGTRMLKQVTASAFLQQPLAFGDQVVFTELSEFSEELEGVTLPMFSQLWITNGTDSGTVPLTNADVRLPADNQLTIVGDRGFFVAHTPERGSELWVTDGTPGGTRMIEDLYPGPVGSNPTGLSSYNGQLVFFADTPDTGMEMWTIAEIHDGPVLLGDINPGPSGSSPDELVLFQDKLVFSAHGDSHGSELWSTDGTVDGTYILFDLAPGPANSFPHNLTVLDKQLYFSSQAGDTGFEPWVTDGTLGGTQLIANVAPERTDSSQPRELTVVGERVFFSADDGIHGHELWITDGTQAGTRMVRDIATGPASADIAEITRVGDIVYFVASDNIHGRELWLSDGSPEGTRLVADILPGPVGSAPYDLTPAGDDIYFVAFDFDHGDEVWFSDGTAEGTHLVVDALPGSEDSLPRHLTYFDGHLYFVAKSLNGHFHEIRDDLWVTDGTHDGTGLVDPTFRNPFRSQYDPRFGWFKQLNDALYFLAFFQLWRIQDNRLQRIDFLDCGMEHGFGWILPTENSLLLYGSPLDRYDYQYLEYFPDQDELALFNSFDQRLWPDPYIPQLTYQGDSLFIVFERADGSSRDESLGHHRLPRNGSQAYPISVTEVETTPFTLYTADDALYFVANHTEQGRELWRSDGTREGASVFADIAPQAGDSHPSQVVRLGDAIIVRADDNATGSELWRVDLPSNKVEFGRRLFDKRRWNAGGKRNRYQTHRVARRRVAIHGRFFRRHGIRWVERTGRFCRGSAAIQVSARRTRSCDLATHDYAGRCPGERPNVENATNG